MPVVLCVTAGCASRNNLASQEQMSDVKALETLVGQELKLSGKLYPYKLRTGFHVGDQVLFIEEDLPADLIGSERVIGLSGTVMKHRVKGVPPHAALQFAVPTSGEIYLLRNVRVTQR